MSLKTEIEKLSAALKKKNGTGIEWYIKQNMHRIDPVQFEPPTGPAPELNFSPELEERIRVYALKEGIIL